MIQASSMLQLTVADESDKASIYKIRHEIYATELRQHLPNAEKQLIDNLDDSNFYIVAKINNQIVGFISITTPSSPKYSVDKYFSRITIPFLFDEFLYEIRLLSVIHEKRNSNIALVLMYAAYRWVQSHGGENIIAICKESIIHMYEKVGLTRTEHKIKSGEVSYILSFATVKNLQLQVESNLPFYEKLQKKLIWRLPCLFFSPSPCYHGGSFFKSIGEELQTINKSKKIISADVLDAWFAPSSKVLNAIQNDLAFLLQTSPPTYADGLIKVIAKSRSIHSKNILPGAGSSNLIFLGLTNLLNQQSKVLIIDPCYGEYMHVLEKVVKCSVTRFNLYRHNEFKIDIKALFNEINKGYNMVILVNPNSPTGVYCSKNELENMLSQVSPHTYVWIDETYIDYAGENESLEQFAEKNEHIIICKSMSKVYALSGARVAYLCCATPLIENLKQFTPPWSISLPAQAAAISALKDPKYYQKKYAETKLLRANLKKGLQKIGITDIVDGVANFILFYLPNQTFTTTEFIKACQKRNLYLRDVSNMGKNIGENAVRIAVKDKDTNLQMLEIIKSVLNKKPHSKRAGRPKV